MGSNPTCSGGSRISRRGGRAPIMRGHGPPTWALFSENVCENERIGSHRGACLGQLIFIKNLS